MMPLGSTACICCGIDSSLRPSAPGTRPAAWRRHLKNEGFNFVPVQNRNRTPVSLSSAIVPELARIIAATPATGMTLLSTAVTHPTTRTLSAMPFTTRAVGRIYLPRGSARGLRKATERRLAEHGASIYEIAAITDHRPLKEVARSTRRAEQRRLAKTAMARLGRNKPCRKTQAFQMQRKSGTKISRNR